MKQPIKFFFAIGFTFLTGPFFSQNKSGLQIQVSNIRSRYEFLSDQSIEITEAKNEFIVKIPLIENLVPSD